MRPVCTGSATAGSIFGFANCRELSLGESLFDELTAEPRRLDGRGRSILGIDELDLRHDLAAGGAALPDLPQDRFHGLLLVGADSTQRRELRIVEIGPRQVPEQIADRPDLEAFEQLLRAFADAGQGRHRQIER
jgi:hypothetical protein